MKTIAAVLGRRAGAIAAAALAAAGCQAEIRVEGVSQRATGWVAVEHSICVREPGKRDTEECQRTTREEGRAQAAYLEEMVRLGYEVPAWPSQRACETTQVVTLRTGGLRREMVWAQTECVEMDGVTIDGTGWLLSGLKVCAGGRCGRRARLGKEWRELIRNVETGLTLMGSVMEKGLRVATYSTQTACEAAGTHIATFAVETAAQAAGTSQQWGKVSATVQCRQYRLR